jgi:hypothetical protein
VRCPGRVSEPFARPVEKCRSRRLHGRYAKSQLTEKQANLAKIGRISAVLAPLIAPIDCVYQFLGINRFYVLHCNIYIDHEPF